MGFVHDTKSEIFGIETRSKSAVLHDLSEDTTHLYFYGIKKSDVRDEIADAIMRQAGVLYGKGDLQGAEHHRFMAEHVRKTAVSPDEKVFTFEATYEWLKELVKFVNENEVLPK